MSDQLGSVGEQNQPTGLCRSDVIIFGVVVLAGIIYLAMREDPREARNLAVRQDQFRQVASGFRDYQNTYNHLPSPARTAQNGLPLLSWRVDLLPFVDEGFVYSQFKLNEPWDSAENTKFVPYLIRAFYPGWNVSAPGHTVIQAFVGPGAAFEQGKAMRLPDDFPDGLSTTILVAEAAEAVPWTKPADLRYSPDRPLPQLGDVSKRGFIAAMGDGSVRFVSHKISEPTLRALITRNGNDVIGTDWKY